MYYVYGNRIDDKYPIYIIRYGDIWTLSAMDQERPPYKFNTIKYAKRKLRELAYLNETLIVGNNDEYDMFIIMNG